MDQIVDKMRDRGRTAVAFRLPTRGTVIAIQYPATIATHFTGCASFFFVTHPPMIAGTQNS